MKRTWIASGLLAAATAGAVGASGCSSSSSPAPTYDPRAQMIAPETCGHCHQQHFAEWLGSMHAKAADDPVFVAMNARGQRLTGGKLGTFCVQCHAPMAVHDGMTKDGLNLASLDPIYKGVTCYFCHSIDSVDADAGHDNAAVHLADDLVMRGELQDPPPIANPAHASKYSTFHDATQRDSAVMCGTCHDIVSPAGAPIERTFAEWSVTPFATAYDQGGSTCSSDGCHMKRSLAEVPVATGGPLRFSRAHDFPAVDVPLSTNPANRADAGAVQDALNNEVLAGALCVSVNSGIRVILDTPNLGHLWPSGAAQDRRAWTEVIAYNGGDTIGYSSGVVAAGTAVTDTAYSPATDAGDPDLFLLRDCMFDAKGHETHNFWEAVTRNGSELPALAIFLDMNTNPDDPIVNQSHVQIEFPGPNNMTYPKRLLDFKPSRVKLRVLLQPVGLDVLNDLVDSGDLDPGPDGALLASMPTFSVSLQGPLGGPGTSAPGGLEWTPASNDVTFQDSAQGKFTCATTVGFNAIGQVEGRSFATCSSVLH